MAYTAHISNGVIGINYSNPVQIIYIEFIGDVEFEVVPEDSFAIYVQNKLYIVLMNEQVVGDVVKYKGNITVKNIILKSNTSRANLGDCQIKHTNDFWEISKFKWESNSDAWEDRDDDGYTVANSNTIKKIVTFRNNGKTFVQPKRLMNQKPDLTSMDNNHKHTYILDVDGNGATSVDNGHRHKIVNYEIQEVDEHSHKLGKKARINYGVK